MVHKNSQTGFREIFFSAETRTDGSKQKDSRIATPQKGTSDSGLSWTPDVENYYRTGELPVDPLERKAFQLMIEKGEV